MIKLYWEIEYSYDSRTQEGVERYYDYQDFERALLCFEDDPYILYYRWRKVEFSDFIVGKGAIHELSKI